MGSRNIARVLPWKLSASAKAVLVMLAYRENDDTGRCDPSIDGLMADTCLSRRTVFRSIIELEAAGAVQAIHREGIRTTYKTMDPCQHDTGNPCHGDTGASQAPVPNTTPTRATMAQTRATVAPEKKNRRKEEGESDTTAPAVGPEGHGKTETESRQPATKPDHVQELTYLGVAYAKQDGALWTRLIADELQGRFPGKAITGIMELNPGKKFNFQFLAPLLREVWAELQAKRQQELIAANGRRQWQEAEQLERDNETAAEPVSDLFT